MLSLARRVRSLRRYRQVATVLARHGFGSALEYLQVDRRLSLPPGSLQNGSESQLSASEHLRTALEELGPTYVKLGQILSTRPDLLPPALGQELRKLQSEVPPNDWEEVKGVVQEELGRPLEEIFISVDPQPIGAASLSQVHAAILLDGAEVVIKVQRPHVQETIEADLEILHDLASLAQRTPLGEIYHPLEVLEDFAATLRNELDYRREGRNADKFRANFENDRHLYIPAIYWDYTTSRVIVMERLYGIKIDNINALEEAGYDRQEIALNAAKIAIKQVMEDGFFHADPHPGNYFVQEGGRIAVMDFGMVGSLSEEDRLNLVRLYVATIKQDSRGIVDLFLRMGAISLHTDRMALERAIERMISKYRGLALEETSFSEFWHDLTAIVYSHHVRLSADMWLMGKTLAMMEGVGRQLDPKFDLFKASEPFVSKLAVHVWLPHLSPQEMLANIDTWSYLLREVPHLGISLLRQLERGRLPLEVKVGGNKESLDRLDKLITRLSLSILVAAFTISLPLLMPAAQQNPSLSNLVLLGFIASLLLGLWLLFSMVRGGR
jgi:ubiquinone biosynthesis protein